MPGIDELGFLPGWGNTVGRVRESFQLLLDIIQARGGGLPRWGQASVEALQRMQRQRQRTSSWCSFCTILLPCPDGSCAPLQAPDADTLEKFLARLPLMFKVGVLWGRDGQHGGWHAPLESWSAAWCCGLCSGAQLLGWHHTHCQRAGSGCTPRPSACRLQVVILSPHGYFGQTNVLGMPDTGGQVRSSRRGSPHRELAISALRDSLQVAQAYVDMRGKHAAAFTSRAGRPGSVSMPGQQALGCACMHGPTRAPPVEPWLPCRAAGQCMSLSQTGPTIPKLTWQGW